MKKLLTIITLLFLTTSFTFTGVKTWVGGTGTGGQPVQWNRPNNWSPPGIPTSSDSVVIPLTANNPVNMNSAPGTCGALTLAGGSIYLSGNLNIVSTDEHGGHLTILSGSTFNVNGSYILDIDGDINRVGTFTQSTGTVILSGTKAQAILSSWTFNHLTITNPAGVNLYENIVANGTLTVNSTLFPGPTNTIGGTGTLTGTGTVHVTRIAATADFNTQYPITNKPLTNLTVNYSGAGDQTVNSYTYNNLIISGSGVKSLDTVTVNGIFSLQGTATASSSTPTYGASATIEYKGSTAQVTGVEFPTTMNAAVSIDNINGVTLNASRTINGNLTYVNGRINTDSYTLTRDNLSGTGIKYLLSANNYINITTAGITSITVQDFANTLPPNTPPEYNSEKGVRRYYTVTNVVGTGAARIRFDYLPSEMGSQFTPTNGNVWQYIGSGPWVNQGALNAGSYFAETASSIASSELAGNYAIADAASALPIQLASFSGSYNLDINGVLLEWITISEINNYGFNVQRLNLSNNRYETIGFVEGAGSSLEPRTYEYIDTDLTLGEITYRLEQLDLNGTKSYSNPIIVMLNPNNVKEKNSVPAVFNLYQNYPNPFNPTTKISFSIDQNGWTTLKVYNMLGQEVETLFAGEAQAGKLFEFNFNGSKLASGIYLARLQSGKNVSIQKMILSK